MSTTTIRIEEDLKARIAAAAERAGKSSHGFILDAIADTVERADLDRVALSDHFVGVMKELRAVVRNEHFAVAMKALQEIIRENLRLVEMKNVRTEVPAKVKNLFVADTPMAWLKMIHRKIQ